MMKYLAFCSGNIRQLTFEIYKKRSLTCRENMASYMLIHYDPQSGILYNDLITPNQEHTRYPPHGEARLSVG